jgi:carbamoyl-phosphate synthase small subunit
MVFNTSMTGYQEVLTDPSYKGQIVAMTYPLIGNYGINTLDDESGAPHVRGFVIEELSAVASNWRSQTSLEEYLTRSKIPGIQGVDTRALTKHLREKGAMKACLTTESREARRRGHGRRRYGLRAGSHNREALRLGPGGQTQPPLDDRERRHGQHRDGQKRRGF